jgi:tRNA U34 5-methylaminomethyl-2-thiouridine-forming methyltransferase MnmC
MPQPRLMPARNGLGSELVCCAPEPNAVYTVRVSSAEAYKLVQLRNGARSIHSLEVGETMHPGIGPVAEAEALYVRQLGLVERVRLHAGVFTIWDVGLGAAANALTVLRSLRETKSSLHLISFEHTLEPLRFALEQSNELGYLAGFEAAVTKLLSNGTVEFENGRQNVRWELCLADFPSFLRSAPIRALAKPEVSLFDPWSPSKNPAMWTGSVFADLFGLLEPTRPCLLPTYSRSTMLRVSLLLADFFVGVGHATGMKEETTIAANQCGLIQEPLGRDWLERARRSRSAEPLWEPSYRQMPLQESTWERLLRHPQFQSA